MTKPEGRSLVFMFCVAGLIVFGAMIDLNDHLMIDTDIPVEDIRNLQNHGTKNVVRPIYYVDPRTEKCFAMFANGSVASVECDDLVKSLMANDWINKED